MWRRVSFGALGACLGCVLALGGGTAGAIDRKTEARVPWDDVYANPDRRVVRITVTTRPAEQVRRAAVRETGDRVRITLIRPRAPFPAADSALQYCVEVKLAARVGGRTLIDGATGRPGRPVEGGIRLTGERPCRRIRANRY